MLEKLSYECFHLVTWLPTSNHKAGFDPAPLLFSISFLNVVDQQLNYNMCTRCKRFYLLLIHYRDLGEKRVT